MKLYVHLSLTCVHAHIRDDLLRFSFPHRGTKDDLGLSWLRLLLRRMTLIFSFVTSRVSSSASSHASADYYDIQPAVQRIRATTHNTLLSIYSNLNTTSSKPVRLSENDYVLKEKFTVQKSKHRLKKDTNFV